MGNRYRNLNYLFTILFIASIIYTTLRLFSLQDDLILSSKVLDSSQIIYITPVLLQLYLAVGSVIVTGIIVLVLNFSSGNESANSAQVSIGGQASNSSKNKQDTHEGAGLSVDTDFVEEAIKALKSGGDKYATVLNTLCQKLELGQGAIYIPKEKEGIKIVQFQSGYAFSIAESETIEFEFGEGLVGQSAKEGKLLMIDNVPDNYINIVSGLGSASPRHLMILPVKHNDTLEAVVELASFHEFTKENIKLIEESFALIHKATKGASDKANPTTTEAEEKPKVAKKSSSKSAKKGKEEGS